MLQLTLSQAQTLRHWFVPDRPGPLVGLHVLQTGHGACFVDRWPDPRAVLAETASNYALHGDPAAVTASELGDQLVGFVEADARFEPLLRRAFPTLQVWPRVILEGPVTVGHPPGVDATLRRLQTEDAVHLQTLSDDIAWITRTFDGPPGLAESGLAWGAFVDDTLVSVACSFFCGERYEDIGVVTERSYRGRGFSAACAAALCADMQTRGRRPSWSTSPDNHASLRVAEKLGFVVQRMDRLLVVGITIPSAP